jgi:hypothetical protein
VNQPSGRAMRNFYCAGTSGCLWARWHHVSGR